MPHQGKRCASATILREQSVIENCEETVSVCESKEEKRFFFSRETHTKVFGVSSRELLSVNS